jgi:hypothetical protein
MRNAIDKKQSTVLSATRNGAGLTNETAGMQRIRFGEILKPLQAAAGQGQSWLDDFCNDDVMLPQDLVDVIQTFARMQAEKKRVARAE